LKLSYTYVHQLCFDFRVKSISFKTSSFRHYILLHPLYYLTSTISSYILFLSKRSASSTIHFIFSEGIYNFICFSFHIFSYFFVCRVFNELYIFVFFQGIIKQRRLPSVIVLYFSRFFFIISLFFYKPSLHILLYERYYYVSLFFSLCKIPFSCSHKKFRLSNLFNKNIYYISC